MLFASFQCIANIRQIPNKSKSFNLFILINGIIIAFKPVIRIKLLSECLETQTKRQTFTLGTYIALLWVNVQTNSEDVQINNEKRIKNI